MSDRYAPAKETDGMSESDVILELISNVDLFAAFRTIEGEIEKATERYFAPLARAIEVMAVSGICGYWRSVAWLRPELDGLVLRHIGG